MPVILVATTNPGKLREYKQIFAGVPDAHIVSPNEAEVWREVAETGETFAENALLKARAFREALPLQAREEGWWVLGDDSGLEVDALGGGPGVHSNRWAGPNSTPESRNRLLLTARFKCVIALVSPDGNEHLAEGTVEGRIAYEPKGSGGFGYDPIFELPNGKRMAELTPDEKNALSHRGIAGAKAAAIVGRMMDDE
jgi:XTP/dITP diphosphohydrolase